MNAIAPLRANVTVAERREPAERAPRRPNVTGAIAIAAAIAFVTVLVLFPLALVFHEAFRDGAAAFARAFTESDARSAIALTLSTAAIALVANTLFGALAGWTIAKYRFPGKALLVSAIDLPLGVSPVVAGLAILLAVGAHAPLGGWLIAHGIRVAFAPPGIALATIFVTFPYVAREVTTFLMESGRELEEAALSLGASTFATVWRITLPSARTALLNGMLLCNARALGEFGAVSVISGHIRGLTDTVPLHIEILYNDDAFVAAFALSAGLATLTIALTLLRSILARVSQARSEHVAP